MERRAFEVPPAPCNVNCPLRITQARSRPWCRCTAADVSPRDSLGEASAEPNRKVLNVQRSSNANLL
ncbi:hypothetical protein EYF80_027856 [Liparis tanakae]|uniref:Uncharacterized protein n=1 Tax=Liparis tanakae TaxID=230148 RepID=A0A4Z2H7Z0_9TELE|nr:hypothetical protein EYF80_027856 [Liparis tanakae]